MLTPRSHAVVLSMFVTLALPSPHLANARDRMPATGSALAPVFSLEHAVMRPGEAVVLVACVTNRNAESRRFVEPGDALVFDGAGIAFLDCESAPVEDRGEGFDPGDWTCSIDGSSLRLTYAGSRRTWPRGELICARVHAIAPMASATVVPTVEVANFGAWAPAEPSVVFLTVDDEIGSVGPVGPMGPQGPTGTPGPADVGELGMATSTRAIAVQACAPPELVPGLDLSVSVGVGARIVTLVDAVTHHECAFGALGGDLRGVLLLEFDGAIVARRLVADPYSATVDSRREQSGSLSWLSDPLAAGSHRVRVLYEYARPVPLGCRAETACIGGLPGTDTAARLTVLALGTP